MAGKSTPAADTLTVNESFVGSVDGVERVFRAGDIIRATDPAAKKWPELFTPVRYTEDVIEHATAAPGEAR